MPTPESEVLKPIDPSITDSDDYEIFVLSNAQVVYQSNGKPASLLAAYADTPLRVEGRLEALDRGQLKYLVKKPYKPVDIVIRNVTRYSYGQMTDGELVIWALGEAGWFEIRPSRNYNAIYQDMVEAVELLYFVTDIYNEPRKRGGGPSAQLIFQEYAEDERYACTDPALASEIFRKHHDFLIMCFLNRAQGIGWSTTSLYQYFRRQNPKAFESAKARIEGRYQQAQRESRASKASPASASAPTPAFEKPSARRKAQTQKPAEHPKKDNNWWEAAAIYEFIRSAIAKRALRPGRNDITLDRVATLMVKRYEIEEMETAKHVLLVHAQNICYKMDHPRSKSASFLVDEPIYRELQTGHELPAAEVRKAEAVELRRRRDYTTLSQEASEDSEEEESDDVIVTPQRRPDGRKKRGRLSVLRPISSKGSKFSGKGKGLKRGKGKRPNIQESSAEEPDSSAEAETESSSDDEIDTPTQALSPSREKRKFIETDGDDEEEKGRRKRTASESATPESPLSTEDDEDEDATAANNEAPLPLRYRPTNISSNSKSSEALSKPLLAPPLVSTPLPTYESNGPRDSWICNFDGCSQRIYGASKEIGQQLITEHLEDHAKNRHVITGILLREEEKLRLPVNNLLKKIREMSESQTPLFPSPALTPESPALQPQPIRRMV